MTIRKNLDEISWKPMLVVENKIVNASGQIVDQEKIIVDLQNDMAGVPIIPNKDDFVTIDGQDYLVTERQWNYDTGVIRVEAR